jgi:hypothetical protein
MSEEPRIKKDSLASGHETTDINARGVAWSAVVLVMIMVVIFFALRGLYSICTKHQPSSVMTTRINTPSLEPRLQVDEVRDLGRLHEHEDSILNSYGWVDQRAGIMRIPIERAMDIVAQRGLPAPPPGPGKTRLEMRQEKANAAKSPP